MAPPDDVAAAQDFLACSLLDLYRRWVGDGRPNGRTPEVGLETKTSDATEEKVA